MATSHTISSLCTHTMSLIVRSQGASSIRTAQTDKTVPKRQRMRHTLGASGLEGGDAFLESLCLRTGSKGPADGTFTRFTRPQKMTQPTQVSMQMGTRLIVLLYNSLAVERHVTCFTSMWTPTVQQCSARCGGSLRWEPHLLGAARRGVRRIEVQNLQIATLPSILLKSILVVPVHVHCT